MRWKVWEVLFEEARTRDTSVSPPPDGAVSDRTPSDDAVSEEARPNGSWLDTLQPDTAESDESPPARPPVQMPDPDRIRRETPQARRQRLVREHVVRLRDRVDRSRRATRRSLGWLPWTTMAAMALIGAGKYLPPAWMPGDWAARMAWTFGLLIVAINVARILAAYFGLTRSEAALERFLLQEQR